ncbi:MAG: hypothetical protein ABW019_07820 [Chitinophagaceae bacterium]
MKRFYIRSLLFLLPVILLVAVPSWVLFSARENFNDIDAVIRKGDKCLMGYAYNENNYGYIKWKALNSRDRYTVVALGSSRVLELRSNMFDSSFYNAGYTITSLNQFVPFLQGIPEEKYPRYLIVSLDQWLFNAGWDSLTTLPEKDKWSGSFTSIPEQTTLVSVWKDLYAGKYSFFLPRKKGDTRYIGLNAVVEGTGFRQDGSALYGKQVRKLLADDSTAMDYHFNETFGWIDKGAMRFNYGGQVNKKALEELERLLQFCQAHGIRLIAFLPPYADRVNEKMRATGRYAYLDSIYPLSLPLFRQYNAELYDLSSLASVGSNDSEAVDGFHGGEVTYLRMLIKMLESGSVLNNVTSLERLRRDVAHPVSRYAVYPE